MVPGSAPSIASGITPDDLTAQIATGKGDGEILAWVADHASHPRAPWEIQAWSAYHNERGPDGDVETLDSIGWSIRMAGARPRPWG